MRTAHEERTDMFRKNNFFNWPMLIMAGLFISLAAYQSVAIRNLEALIKPAVLVTVDLERVFNNLDEREAADVELQRLAEQLQSQGNRRAEEIDGIREDLEIYTPGSDEHQEMLTKLAMTSHDYRAFVEFSRMRIDASKAVTMRRIYSSIKAAVEREAQAKGYDVVFVNDSLAPLPTADEVETSRQISARRMLYSNPQLDITQDIITRMNNEFRTGNHG
jgi:Skp family chaperone for outer membrane proteins